MHPTTIEALLHLRAALKLWPEDRKLLEIYGRLPEHLDDALEDWQTGSK